MKQSLTYDAELDAWILRTEGVLRTPEDVEAWRDGLLEKLGRIGKKVYLVIDISDFEVSSEVAKSYGQVAKEVSAQYALGIVRYGRSQGGTATSVRLEAVVNRYRSNVFASREEAVRALDEMRERAE